MKRLSILIADAAPEICWLVARWLRSHHLTCVHSAKEALLASRLLRFDLVVSDLNLRNEAGQPVLEIFRENQPGIRQIALCPPETFWPAALVFERAITLGADSVLMKPVSERKFLLALRACWHDRASEQPSDVRPACRATQG